MNTNTVHTEDGGAIEPTAIGYVDKFWINCEILDGRRSRRRPVRQQ